jgi:hypothetical protein
MKSVLVFFVAFVLMIFLTTAQIEHTPTSRQEEHRVRSNRHLLNEATSVGRKVLNVDGDFKTQEVNPNQGFDGTSSPSVRHHYYPEIQRPATPHN